MSMMSTRRQVAEEELRAEVEVLNNRLEKTRILNKKLAASLTRLEESGKSVREAIGPLYGETQMLKVFGSNLDGVINAIERIRQPSDIKSNEEEIIRLGPEKAGLSSFLNSVKRLNKALSELRQTNLRSNQQAVSDIARLLKSGNQQLEGYFRRMLLDDSNPIEPLYYTTKDKPFPVLSSDVITRLGLIISYIQSESRKSEISGPTTSQLYASVRGPYLLQCLQNLASATVQTLRKKSPDDIYVQGTNGIGTYAKSMELAFSAEYNNICTLFSRDEWGKVFHATCQGSIAELMRTLRDVNNHIKINLNTDCYLAYEVLEIMSNLSSNLEKKTGELKPSFAAALKPIRDTAKSSLAELLEITRYSITKLPTVPQDGAAAPITTETMIRLQNMVGYLRPISSIMISIGDNGWRSSSTAALSPDQIPSLNLFDVGADGKQIFTHYTIDTIDMLLGSLEQKAKSCFKTKATLGVFMANNAVVVDRMVRGSELLPLLSIRLGDIEKWRRNGEILYTQAWREPAAHLFDKSYTNRPLAGNRPTSGSAGLTDSVASLKALSSKERDGIKEKFRLFNACFDELVAKHKLLNMEPEVRESLARQIQQMIEPLYGRFWDRYHEIDKGKGKYVKYDKSSMSAIFSKLG
ncbi:Exocyst complex protein [Podosphaera aphanis]|nr:Exocyst complex protein [Podosphaera aphanis]